MSTGQTMLPLPEISHHAKLPQGANEIARLQMHNPKKLYVFIKYNGKLIIHSSREAMIDGVTEYISGQIGLPMGFLSWFPQALDDFLTPPDEGGLRAGAMSSNEELVEGERLAIVRNMGDRAWPEKGPPPGYAVMNYSRPDDSYAAPNHPSTIDFSERFLFEGGLLSLIRQLGAQYSSGTL